MGLADNIDNIEPQENWAFGVLSGVKEEHLFPPSKYSDSEFVVALQDKINGRDSVRYGKLFLSFRSVGLVASACVILIVAIIAGGRLVEQRLSPLDRQVAQLDYAPSTFVVDSLADAGVDPVELAQYLNVPDYVEEDVADTADDMPLTEQLLTLDTGTLNEVLNNLETTEFF
jgi:hypothetical protein